MTVSLEEAANGGEKRVRLPNGKELNVRIPAGVSAGQQIRLKGQGETAQGHPPGDLLITVNIAPHAFFKVDGSDLRLDLPITLYEAVLGGKIRVPTLGGAVELSIPTNTSSGRTFRLKGKGLPKAGAGGWRPVRYHPYHVTRWKPQRPRGIDAEVARRTSLQSAQRSRLSGLRAATRKRCGLERGTSAVLNPDRGRLRRSADRTHHILAITSGAIFRRVHVPIPDFQCRKLDIRHDLVQPPLFSVCS